MGSGPDIFDPDRGWDTDVGDLRVYAPQDDVGTAFLIGQRVALEKLRDAIDEVLAGAGAVGFQAEHGNGQHQLVVVAESDATILLRPADYEADRRHSTGQAPHRGLSPWDLPTVADTVDAWTREAVVRALSGLQRVP